MLTTVTHVLLASTVRKGKFLETVLQGTIAGSWGVGNKLDMGSVWMREVDVEAAEGSERMMMVDVRADQAGSEQMRGLDILLYGEMGTSGDERGTLEYLI